MSWIDCSDFGEGFGWFFIEKLLDSGFAQVLVFEPFWLIDFHWECKSFDFFFVNVELLVWKIGINFVAGGWYFNEFLDLRIGLSLRDLHFWYFLHDVLCGFWLSWLLLILIVWYYFMLIRLKIGIIGLIIILIIKFKGLVWVFRVLLRFDILFGHGEILVEDGDVLIFELFE